jgi:hypothetical protein
MTLANDLLTLCEVHRPNDCVQCGKPATHFTDDKSHKEWEESGRCQQCQLDDESAAKHMGKKKNEGRRFIPLKGHPYHTKSDDSLRYIIKDAAEAAKAMRGMNAKAEGKYLDQVSDAHTILNYRKSGGKQITPKG